MQSISTIVSEIAFIFFHDFVVDICAAVASNATAAQS